MKHAMIKIIAEKIAMYLEYFMIKKKTYNVFINFIGLFDSEVPSGFEPL